MATRARPPSRKAVSFRVASDTTVDFNSLPISIFSLACSKSAIVTALESFIAALIAAMLIKFARSAPENPGVPRAMIIRSTSASFTTFDMCDSKICCLPLTS
ncbi:hypothetical protein V8G54_037814, partial [Vigna mungo]